MQYKKKRNDFYNHSELGNNIRRRELPMLIVQVVSWGLAGILTFGSMFGML
jgi:hypothetical protein